MNIQQKRDFLTTCAYWAVIIAGAYLAFEYLLPFSVPVILGVLIAYLVVWSSRKVHCTHKVFRLLLAVLIYGVIGLLIGLLAVEGVSAVSAAVKWLPQMLERKVVPFAMVCYEWCMETVRLLDPALISALEMLMESLLSGLKNLISYLSGYAVDLVSSVATGVPTLILSLLAMIFTTFFTVADYERIRDFAAENMPEGMKRVLKNVRLYLTETLFVVIRSYLLIMALTFTELSILFAVCGIDGAVWKAGFIAIFDLLPILGTGGVMIPWAVISLVLGYTSLGIRLFIIYGIVTVVRNYVEPRIVGAQLGLHPIISLVAMFIGMRLSGVLGLFGLPVGISFLWKQKQEREQQRASEGAAEVSGAEDGEG